jgi:hypothetical protein
MMKKIEQPSLKSFESKIRSLSERQLKDLLLTNTYKLAMARAQVEALAEILVKKKLITYEEYWKLTNEIFQETKI